MRLKIGIQPDGTPTAIDLHTTMNAGAFVASGMNLDLASIAEAPLRLIVFFGLLLAVRGLPAMFLYRRDLGVNQRLQMTLLTATALPLLVALSEIGLSTGHMLPENAAALVGAGVLSVMIFPGLAVVLHRREMRDQDLHPGGVGVRGSA